MAYDSTIEDLVDSVESFLSTNVAAYVTGINDAKADGITLKAIRDVSVSDNDPYQSAKYPLVQLYPEQLALEQIAAGYDEAVMSLIALVAINDKSSVQKKLLRYTEAVRQVLRDYVDLGESEFDVDKGQMVVTYYPTDPDVGVAVSTVQFRVIKTIES
jgi:hypothetical protein